MAAQRAALRERRAQLRQNCLLAFREHVRIAALLDRREIGMFELAAPAAWKDRARRAIVDAVEKAPPVHLEVRIARDERPFELEEHHRDRALRRTDRTLVGIEVRGERRERAHRNAVAAFEDVRIAVAQRVAHDRRDARFAAKRRAHPKEVVVAPLDVDVRVLHEAVEDRVGPVPAVKKIADDMEPVHREPLDEHGKRLDEVRARIDLDDRGEEALPVCHLCCVRFRTRRHELDDDGGVARGDEPADLRGGVLEAHELRERQEPFEVRAVPCRRRTARLPHLLDLLFRVVDERAELRLFSTRHPRAENVFHLFADDARAVVENMEKRLVLAVQIAQKMLDPLREREPRLQVNELFIDDFLRRVLLRQKAEDLARPSR